MKHLNYTAHPGRYTIWTLGAGLLSESKHGMYLSIAFVRQENDWYSLGSAAESVGEAECAAQFLLPGSDELEYTLPQSRTKPHKCLNTSFCKSLSNELRNGKEACIEVFRYMDLETSSNNHQGRNTWANRMKRKAKRSQNLEIPHHRDSLDCPIKRRCYAL